MDSQVKIRGFRIELNEIENCLLKHEGIKEAVVVAARDSDKDDRYLCAYIAADVEVSTSRLRNIYPENYPTT